MPSMSGPQLMAYLGRIGLDAPPPATLEGVSLLHRAHLATVPFESLDIHLGRPISLDLDALVAKVVEDRRGGFCYESNLVFAAAVGALGLGTDLYSARAVRDNGGFGPPFDHLVLHAELDAVHYLLDVGFGEGFRSPLPVDGDWHTEEPGAGYRARREAAGLVVEHRAAGGVEPDYSVDPRPRRRAEFAAMCRFHHTSPDSGFTRRWTVSLATAHGRITLLPGRFIETRNGRRQETPVASADHLAAILDQSFGITGVDVERLARVEGPASPESVRK